MQEGDDEVGKVLLLEKCAQEQKVKIEKRNEVVVFRLMILGGNFFFFEKSPTFN